MKKMLSLGLSFSMAVMLGACGAKTTPTTTSVSSEGGTKQTQRETVNFWYLWGGEEAKIIEEIISQYNSSQDKYEVVGTSTPDQQVIITAISGDNETIS